MCEARCGLRMQGMWPVFPFTLCKCVQLCDSLTPMEQYGMDPILGQVTRKAVRDEVRFFMSGEV